MDVSNQALATGARGQKHSLTRAILSLMLLVTAEGRLESAKPTLVSISLMGRSFMTAKQHTSNQMIFMMKSVFF